MQIFGICVPFRNENSTHLWLTNIWQKLHSNWMKNKTFKFWKFALFGQVYLGNR